MAVSIDGARVALPEARAGARDLELLVFLDTDRSESLAPPRRLTEGVAARPVGRALALLERVRGGDAVVGIWLYRNFGRRKIGGRHSLINGRIDNSGRPKIDDNDDESLT